MIVIVASLYGYNIDSANLSPNENVSETANVRAPKSR